jgi:predicted alpha/beta-fold hydrolase
MLTSNSYLPALPLRSAHLQTILASSKLRTWGKNPMRNEAREMILETSDGIQLLGYYSPQKSQPAKGLVIILHGWEGSADSTYLVCTGRTFYQSGYDIFRLNFRDHGDSHHLNTGIFYAVLLDEVFQAVKQAAGLNAESPVFLVGFSLGGNFVLRIVRKCNDSPIANLQYAVAISPVLDPDKATDRIDHFPIIRSYFLKKWRTSLIKKQRLFPDLYDFNSIMKHKTIREVTDVLLNDYSDYHSTKDYFKAYSVVRGAIKDNAVSTTIMTAADDPIIPVEDFYELEINESTNLVIQPYGGHNGFLDGFYLQGWYEKKLVELFDGILEKN